MARNRQRAKERQARRKAREGDGGAPRTTPPVPTPPVPVAPPPLSESERLRAGAPPEDVGSTAEVLEYEQDLDGGDDPEHFDPSQDIAEEDRAADGAKRRRVAQENKHRPRLVQFLIAVWAELQRVQWPDRQALITLTGVVLGFVLIAGGYLGLLDAIASRLIQAIL